MPLLFSKYPTTFVRLMVSVVRKSTATPATNSSARATATNVLALRFKVRHPPVGDAAPHRAPARAREAASGRVWNPDLAAPRREALVAGRRAAARAVARGRGSSQ